LSPFSAEFIATVLAKLPGEEQPHAEAGSPPPLEQGHSEFLESLLGILNPSGPAILPAPGQFSLVGCIAESAAAAAVDSGGPPLTAAAEVAEKGVERPTPDTGVAPNIGMDGGLLGKIPQEVRIVKAACYFRP